MGFQASFRFWSFRPNSEPQAELPSLSIDRRVALGITPPGLPQIRTCPTKAYGSSD